MSMASDDPDESAWCARLADGAAELGIALDATQTARLWRLTALLRERNRDVNLTSIDTLEGILTVHVLDSLAVVPHLGGARCIADVGTGGGFPGVPLAIACPERRFTLIDGTQKKIRFVAETIEALGLTNVAAVASRTEQYRPESPFDLVIARAVGRIPDVLRATQHLLTEGGALLAMKGRRPDDELRALPRGWRAEVVPLRVPLLEAERHLVRVRRARGAGLSPTADGL